MLAVRLAARVLDAALLTTLSVALGRAVGFGAGWFVATAGGTLGYFALADALFGATPGKRALGLEVRGPSGARPTVAEAVRREAFTLIGAVPFVGPLLAVVAWSEIALAARGGRPGFHDRLARTSVVRR
jgi:uncharacterized RDD family membrane protein YckC